MTSKAALFALLSLWGVSAVAMPAYAEEAAPVEESEEAEADSLTNRVWVRADADPALPGVMKIFLSDGTLVQDSCWETHRFSPWKTDGANAVSWDEDGMEIRADIVTLTADELVLNLKLRGGDLEERYAPAQIPFLCPDMPKG